MATKKRAPAKSAKRPASVKVQKSKPQTLRVRLADAVSEVEQLKIQVANCWHNIGDIAEALDLPRSTPSVIDILRVINQGKSLKVQLAEARSQIEQLDVKVMEGWRDLDQVATALGLHVEKRATVDILGAIQAERSIKEQAQQRATDAEAKNRNMLREIGTRLFGSVAEPFDSLEIYTKILHELEKPRAENDMIANAMAWLDKVCSDPPSDPPSVTRETTDD